MAGSNHPDKCPRCGLEYDKMRTGLTFGQVKDMLWVGSDNPEDWRYKRRHTVLGFWRALKLDMWEMHLGYCGHEEEGGVEPVLEYDEW